MANKKRTASLASLAVILLIMLALFTFQWIQNWQVANAHYLTVAFVDVGQGDCEYLRTPQGKHVLIDGGGAIGGGSRSVGKQIVEPYLKKQGVFSLDAVYVSHYHDDHGKGVAELLEAHGPTAVHEPYVKHIEDKLWEMRMRGKDGIARAIYISVRPQRIVVLHAFIKKTQRIPRRAIHVARERAKEVFP